jgi:ParB family chromosome partitioning protein
MAKVTASGFSISGLLDSRAQTQSKFPVVEIAVSDIEDHPANVVYSMNAEGIERLAKSIERDGLTDLPLVRKLPDGRWQMVSGHRRKAAYALLAKTSDKYAKLPCRIVSDITDEESVALLHSANYFVRSLSVTERAAASRALGVQVEQLRESNPELAGVRTEDIKAAIISEQTGKHVSGKSIRRQEALTQKIEEKLTPSWQEIASKGELSAAAVEELSALDETKQNEVFDSWRQASRSKKETTAFVKAALSDAADATDEAPVDTTLQPSTHLRQALDLLDTFQKTNKSPLTEAEVALLSEIQSKTLSLLEMHRQSSLSQTGS